MRKFFILLILSCLSFPALSQITEKNIPKVDWNAYSQIRFETDFNDNNNFLLRRLKIWIKSVRL